MDKTIAQIFELRGPTAIIDKKLDKKRDGLEVINSEQLVGIEVELEKSDVKMKHKSEVWVGHGDGSLRNNGLEWITHPIPACDAPAALMDLFEGGANQCCFTPRTSIHVHFNCCDMTKDQVLDTVLLYLHFERQLYAYVGKSRIKNIYCVPINETGLSTKLATTRFDTVCARWKKYTGMNLLPLTSKGTIEFRQMHGTADVRKISIWIRILNQMFEYAKKHPTSETRARVSGIWDYVSLAKLGEDVFGEDWKHLRAATPPSLSDCFTAKQAMTTGKFQMNLDTFAESPFNLFKG